MFVFIICVYYLIVDFVIVKLLYLLLLILFCFFKNFKFWQLSSSLLHTYQLNGFSSCDVYFWKQLTLIPYIPSLENKLVLGLFDNNRNNFPMTVTVKTLQTSVAAAEERYYNAISNQQDKVDKNLVKNLIINYVLTAANSK